MYGAGTIDSRGPFRDIGIVYLICKADNQGDSEQQTRDSPEDQGDRYECLRLGSGVRLRSLMHEGRSRYTHGPAYSPRIVYSGKSG